MKPHVKIIFALVLLAAAAAGAWFAGKTFAPAPPVALVHGTRLTPPREIPEFSLVSHEGRPLHRAQLAGRWTLMFFGFTHCPGICPMTLSMLGDVSRRLAELPETDRPQIVFVTVDPERDTPAAMADYLKTFQGKAFNDPILGITGEPPAISTLAAALGIAHRKLPMTEGEYMVDHTVVVLLLDPEARQAAVFSEPLDAAAIAADYLRMLGRTPRRD